MPLKKTTSRKNPSPARTSASKNRAKIPTKESVYQKHGTMRVGMTARSDAGRRINALASSGRKKKPK